MVGLFSKNREHEVQSFMLKLVNNHCPELKGLAAGRRLETRVNLTLVVLVVPVKRKKLDLEDRFTAITKEFTTRGVALVLNECRAPDRVVLGFRWGEPMWWLLGESKHLSPMGGGFWQLGIHLQQMVYPDEYPGLESLYL